MVHQKMWPVYLRFGYLRGIPPPITLIVPASALDHVISVNTCAPSMQLLPPGALSPVSMASLVIAIAET